MFEFIKNRQPGDLLNQAYSSLPTPDITPRAAYQKIVANNVEKVTVSDLEGRTAANGVIPYPPGIPMLMSGENFGKNDSPQIRYLSVLQDWNKEFPGFEHEIEGAEMVNDTYCVACVKRPA